MKYGATPFIAQGIRNLTLGCLLVGGHLAVAAPGTLTDRPLVLETATVQPNLFFLIDDSGSMNWEDLLNAGTDFPADSVMSDSGLEIPPSGGSKNLKLRVLCRGYNVMAYNPKLTYKPWAGVDSASNAYTDLTLTTARANPYLTSQTDISDHVYVKWDDTDADGAYDGPGSTDGNAAASASDECDIANPVAVNTLSAAEQRNYANWWSYYRKREYVMKRALSQIIKESTARVGIGSLHNHNSIRTTMKDIDDISVPVDTTTQSNKTALLKNLFNVDSANGTPLRNGLKNVGEYFAGNLSATWGSSPILPAADGGQCQKNFAVIMSDGFWNGSSPDVGNTDQGSGPWDGASYADSYSNTLADVAMKYYETDLSALANQVRPTPGIDENTAQHLVTYTVAFGVNGTLSANPPNRTDAFSWPQPVSNTPTTIDDMRHAAWNGRGLFLSASDPGQLISSLNNAIKDIDARSGTLAAASFNSTSLQTDSRVYLASFDSTDWHGTLEARSISADGISSTLEWGGKDADMLLNARDPATRKIYTYTGSADAEFDAANLSATQQADLLSNKPAAETDSDYLKRIVAFLRGDHKDEVGGSGKQDFRNRNEHRLGDIVHSGPVYLGVPRTSYPDAIEGSGSKLYSSFVTAQSSRKGTVFVGANDGMLHAFDATNGAERYAYIPNLVYSTAAGQGLHALAEPLYDHQYYVDLTPSIADVYVDGGWKSYLIGALRAGGKGLFVLDVTNEGSAQTQLEFTHTDLGFTFSEVQVGKLNNGKWAALFGNGYNSSGDGEAKLFIVYLDASGYELISTNTGSMVASGTCDSDGSDCNGLSTPEIADLNGDGTIDRVFAGDLHGNLWTFDLSDTSASNWGLAYSDGKPLFSACRGTLPCAATDRQPITTKPAIAWHPTQTAASTYSNVMVSFGTGQFLTKADLGTDAIQSFYGVWDSGTNGLTRALLQAQTLTQSSKTINGKSVSIRTLSDEVVDYSATTGKEYGWYIDLKADSADTTSKERVVVNPTIYGDIVFFNTLIPQTGVCSSAVSGWLMTVSLLNGGAPDFVVVDVTKDKQFNSDDMKDPSTYIAGIASEDTPTESRFIGDMRVTANVGVDAVQPVAPERPSRMSWTVQ